MSVEEMGRGIVDRQNGGRGIVGRGNGEEESSVEEMGERNCR